MLGKPDDPKVWGIYRPSEIILRNEKAAYALQIRWPGGKGGAPFEYSRISDVS
jgi:hypothetical protein